MPSDPSDCGSIRAPRPSGRHGSPGRSRGISSGVGGGEVGVERQGLGVEQGAHAVDEEDPPAAPAAPRPRPGGAAAGPAARPRPRRCASGRRPGVAANPGPSTGRRPGRGRRSLRRTGVGCHRRPPPQPTPRARGERRSRSRGGPAPAESAATTVAPAPATPVALPPGAAQRSSTRSPGPAPSSSDHLLRRGVLHRSRRRARGPPRPRSWHPRAATVSSWPRSATSRRTIQSG